MKSISWIRRLIHGTKNHTWAFIVTIFATYSVGWALVEPIIAIIPSLSPIFTGWSRFLALLGISILISTIKISQPVKLRFHLQNNVIEIVFDDLFVQQGIKVIPVSTYMHEIEIIPSSLQAIVMNRIVKSDEGTKGYEKYKAILNEALTSKPHTVGIRLPERGTEKRYPVGTTALIEFGEEEYLLFAVTKTELKGHIPSNNCSLSELWGALEAMWISAKSESRGKDINIPLLGGGIIGISVPPSRLLEVNLLAILNVVTQVNKITTGTIRIVLHPSYFEHIDLTAYKSVWNH